MTIRAILIDRGSRGGTDAHSVTRQIEKFDATCVDATCQGAFEGFEDGLPSSCGDWTKISFDTFLWESNEDDRIIVATEISHDE